MTTDVLLTIDTELMWRHHLNGLPPAEVIERSLLDGVFKELKLQSSGAVSEESAKEIGKLLGVEAVVNGTLMLSAVWHWKHLRWKIDAISRLKTIFVVIGTCLEYTGSGRRTW